MGQLQKRPIQGVGPILHTFEVFSVARHRTGPLTGWTSLKLVHQVTGCNSHRPNGENPRNPTLLVEATKGAQQKAKGAWPGATARHCPTRCSCWLHLQYPYRSARVPTLSEHSRSRRDMSFPANIFAFHIASILSKKTHIQYI